MRKLLGSLGAFICIVLISYDLVREEVPKRGGSTVTMASNPVEFWISIAFQCCFVLAFIYLGFRSKK
jgi:hypothetical protein